MIEKTGFYFMFDEWPMISQLPDVQIGKLIRAIVEYETTGEIIQLPQLTSMAFFSVKGRLDRFDANRAKKSAAGKKGMESRWGSKQEQAKSTTSITGDNPTPTPVPTPEPELIRNKVKGYKGATPAEPDVAPPKNALRPSVEKNIVSEEQNIHGYTQAEIDEMVKNRLKSERR